MMMTMMMMSSPLMVKVIQVILVKVKTAELVFGDSFRGGANGLTGFRPRRMDPWITSRGQRATSRGGRGLAEGGGCGAARADGVGSGVV